MILLIQKKIKLTHLDIEDISILVVDDSRFSLNYICKILNGLGVELITKASNGKEAFDLLSTQKTIPILMVTSEQDENRLAAVEQAGVSAVLDIPFKPSSIRKFIFQLLN